MKALTRSQKNKFYGSTKWRRRRLVQLAKDPFCVICLRDKKELVVASVCDHISNEWTNFHEFLTFELQSLCSPCHIQKTAFYDLPKVFKAKKTKIKTFSV